MICSGIAEFFGYRESYNDVDIKLIIHALMVRETFKRLVVFHLLIVGLVLIKWFN